MTGFNRPLLALLLFCSTVAGAQGRLALEDNQWIAIDSPLLASPEPNLPQGFGRALAGGSGFLLIGSPFMQVDGQSSGGVHQIFGREHTGLIEDSRNRLLAPYGFNGDTEAFGWSIASGFFKGGRRTRCEDVDCEGLLDVIIGQPFAEHDGQTEAGIVEVHIAEGLNNCGGRGLLICDGLLWIGQGRQDLLGNPEPEDRYGWSLAVGDFNGDGGEDLAIGVPNETVNGISGAGAVHSVMGDPVVDGDPIAEGLTPFNDELWSQANLEGFIDTGERFGYALAAGDYNGDGVDDLAVGVPYDVIDGEIAGSVNVLLGEEFELAIVNEGGLRILGNDRFSQAGAIGGEPEHLDEFGAALASGDFDGDRVDDLAVGVPGEDIGSIESAGAINIIYGEEGSTLNLGGLTADGDRLFSADSSGVPGLAEQFDLFGSALAVGNFNADEFDDLAIGVPGEDIESGDNVTTNTGAVVIMLGGSNGLSSSGSYTFTTQSLGTPGQLSANTEFGRSLAVGDFDLDGRDDLAVGTTNGHVAVIYHRTRDLLFGSSFE